MNSDTKGSLITPLSKYKLVFLGDQSVGKTSIINRFMFDTFDGKDHPTVGIDFISKTLYYDDRTIRLQLWDTAGQERFRSLIPSYIRDSAVAVVCFDVTSKSSFNSVGKWIEDVRSERGSDVIIFIVGNKIDVEQRQVFTEQGSELAKELDAHFVEVSAKSGTNVEQLFKMIASTLPGTEISQMMQSVVNNANPNQGNTHYIIIYFTIRSYFRKNRCKSTIKKPIKNLLLIKAFRNKLKNYQLLINNIQFVIFYISMDQAYPDITPNVIQALHTQGLKPLLLQPIPDLYNPHKQAYWATNAVITLAALTGRHYAGKQQSIRYLWSFVVIAVPLLAIGAQVKLDGNNANGGHRRTLEEKLDYSPITRRAWHRALDENKKYQDSILKEIDQMEFDLLRKGRK